MKYNRLIWLVVGLILFIHLTNRIINTWLAEDNDKIPKAETLLKATAKEPGIVSRIQKHKPKYPLIADDPAQYGIISKPAGEMPRTQLEWDVFMQKALVESKALEVPEAKPALEKMKKSSEQFQARQQEVDQRISLLEEQLKENPTDPETQEKLQTLFMLKSLGKVLEDKVTAP